MAAEQKHGIGILKNKQRVIVALVDLAAEETLGWLLLIVYAAGNAICPAS